MPRSAIIWTRSRELSLNVRYHRTHRTIISWSKCRPLKSSCTEAGSVIQAVTAGSRAFQVCTRTKNLRKLRELHLRGAISSRFTLRTHYKWPARLTAWTSPFSVRSLTSQLRCTSAKASGALEKVQRNWLLKLRTEKGLAQAVKLAGPFIMSSQGKPLESGYECEGHITHVPEDRPCYASGRFRNIRIERFAIK